jgi:2-C-methyl-D-erythritol 4-phosphate cytidylyltransferase
MPMHARVVALIPSAGRGRRFGRPIEKQFIPLADKPLLSHTLEAFQRSPFIQGIMLVVPDDWVQKVLDIVVRPYHLPKVIGAVAGGEHRQDSVRHGLEALDDEWDIVMIHDGARPFVTQEIIEESVRMTLRYGASLVGVPATDTIKQVNSDGRVGDTLNRHTLWMAQTPQTFRYDLIQRAHAEAKSTGHIDTDDAALVERLGHKVVMVRGSEDNIKVTTPRDLFVAEGILNQRTDKPT